MAHFAKIGANFRVLDIVVVADTDCQDADGNESEVVGIKFLERLTGHPDWIQCSYNSKIRGRYPGPGYTYDEYYDCFIPPKPFPSWKLDKTNKDWEAPVAMPDDDYIWTWDEASETWVNSSTLKIANPE